MQRFLPALIFGSLLGCASVHKPSTSPSLEKSCDNIEHDINPRRKNRDSDFRSCLVYATYLSYEATTRMTLLSLNKAYGLMLGIDEDGSTISEFSGNYPGRTSSPSCSALQEKVLSDVSKTQLEIIAEEAHPALADLEEYQKRRRDFHKRLNLMRDQVRIYRCEKE